MNEGEEGFEMGEPPETCTNYQTTVDSLNVRSAPSKTASIVGRYHKREQVCVYSVSNGWARTGYGWVSAEYIVPSGQVSGSNHDVNRQSENLQINANNQSSRLKNYPYVCYDKKRFSAGQAIYKGCIRSKISCKRIGKYHFGKYPNDQKAHAAFKRCYTSNPKFVDTQGL
jgi:hypothetical protein